MKDPFDPFKHKIKKIKVEEKRKVVWENILDSY